MQFTTGGTQVSINVPNREALIQQAHDKLRKREGFAVATLNLDHLVKLAAQHDFAQAYSAHDMVVADGRPIVWLSRLAGRRVQLAPGSDLVVPLCEMAQQANAGVALIGSTETVLRRSASALEAQVPGLAVPLCVSPSRSFDPFGKEADQILSQLAISGAGLCLLALGAPKQEIFAARARQIVPHVGFVSVGAGLDFIAGHQARAPRWMRAIALEWLWRALHSPARMLPRYVRCFAVLPGLVVSSLRLRRQRRPVSG